MSEPLFEAILTEERTVPLFQCRYYELMDGNRLYLEESASPKDGNVYCEASWITDYPLGQLAGQVAGAFGEDPTKVLAYEEGSDPVVMEDRGVDLEASLLSSSHIWRLDLLSDSREKVRWDRGPTDSDRSGICVRAQNWDAVVVIARRIGTPDQITQAIAGLSGEFLNSAQMHNLVHARRERVTAVAGELVGSIAVALGGIATAKGLIEREWLDTLVSLLATFTATTLTQASDSKRHDIGQSIHNLTHHAP